jgi:hypothetical protein
MLVKLFFLIAAALYVGIYLRVSSASSFSSYLPGPQRHGGPPSCPAI